MSAPLIWIIIPLLVSTVLFFIRNNKTRIIIACLVTFFLGFSAWLLPIDSTISLGNISLKIAPAFTILGRQLIISSADRSILALIYGSAFFWFIPLLTQKQNIYFVPISLAITVLMVASLAVEPFLYAAMLIEICVLLSIPILSSPNQKPGKGIIRYLIFQTLAVPFVLFAGWLMVGIEGNPGNIDLVRMAAVLLGMGFAFLLALFPFYSWIPLLAEDAHPYPLGFILWMMPTATLLFGVGFLDRYTWLRDASLLGTILTTTGILMIVTGGVLAAFERRLARMMGYAIIIESGYSILSLGLGGKTGTDIFLLLFIPRLLGFGLWAYSLSLLKDHFGTEELDEIHGLAKEQPFLSAALVVASMSIAGIPLLAGFSVHLFAWNTLGVKSLPLVIWTLIGNFGLLISIFRVISSLAKKPPSPSPQIIISRSQRFLLIVGGLVLLLFGLFPQWTLPLWTNLPAIFSHLAQ